MGRKKDEEIEIYGGYAHGRRVDSGYPESLIGTLQPHEYPDEHQIATLRQYFPQADLDDYEIRATGPGRVP